MAEKAEILRQAGEVLLKEAEKEEGRPPTYSEAMIRIYENLCASGMPMELADKLVLIAAQSFLSR